MHSRQLTKLLLLAAHIGFSVSFAIKLPAVNDALIGTRSEASSACQFPGLPDGTVFSSIDQSAQVGFDCCVEWRTDDACDTAWEIEEQESAQNAMGAQIKSTRRGGLSTGGWTADALPGTTSVTKQVISPFDHVFVNAQSGTAAGGKGAKEWFYMVEGDAAYIKTTLSYPT